MLSTATTRDVQRRRHLSPFVSHECILLAELLGISGLQLPDIPFNHRSECHLQCVAPNPLIPALISQFTDQLVLNKLIERLPIKYVGLENTDEFSCL